MGEPQAGELAERFRPWLKFDSGEQWRPLNVDYLFDEGDHGFCTRTSGEPKCDPIPNAKAFDAKTGSASALGPGTYVDIAGGSVPDYRGPERCETPLLDCGDGPRSAIYYHVIESNGRFYIDYWWFLRFNHVAESRPSIVCAEKRIRELACDEHEGDWEGVTVVTPPGDETHVDYVVYAAHKGTFRYSASQLELKEGIRPVVYVARGTHASYPKACTAHCLEPAELAFRGLVTLPEEPFGGERDWARDREPCPANQPGSCLQSLPLQPWSAWPGEWGAGCADVCHDATDVASPRSPGLQTRYQTPWCSSQNGALTCDGRALRCSDWLGPLVAAVACDPAALEKGLRATSALSAGGLAITVGGRSVSHATTPGVVQALGSPLVPGDRATVTADGPNTQVLIRARQGSTVTEDRFAALGATAGQRLEVTVSEGAKAPEVLVAGHRFTERRILEALPAVAGAQLKGQVQP